MIQELSGNYTRDWPIIARNMERHERTVEESKIDPFAGGILRGVIVETVKPTNVTEVRVAHTLGRIPKGFVVINNQAALSFGSFVPVRPQEWSARQLIVGITGGNPAATWRFTVLVL